MKKCIKLISVLLIILIVVLLIVLINNGKRKIQNNKYGTLELEAPYVNYPPIPEGFAYKEGTVETGYVIQDTSENEFVWVPINGTNILQERKNYVGDINFEECEDELSEEQLNSINQYNGFWIGRYEASIEGISKSGQIPESTITKQEAIEKCTSYNTGNQAVSHLIYGVEYDMAIQFIEMINLGYATSTTAGNYGSVLLQTDASTDVQQNIYDLAGNLREWTMEAKTSNNAGIIRGGSYNNSLSAGYRSSDNAQTKDKYIGYRCAMYVKDVNKDKIPLRATTTVDNIKGTKFDVTINLENGTSGTVYLYINSNLYAQKQYTEGVTQLIVNVINQKPKTQYSCYAIIQDNENAQSISNTAEIQTLEVTHEWKKWNVAQAVEMELSKSDVVKEFSKSNAGQAYSSWFLKLSYDENLDKWLINGDGTQPADSNFTNNMYTTVPVRNTVYYFKEYLGMRRQNVSTSASNAGIFQWHYKYKYDVYTITDKTNVKGTIYKGIVKSTNYSEYPQDGEQGGFWYEYVGSNDD